ncbi:MAG TPA: LysM peptidoglycan-binding domain-containing protein [Thermoanaerobaculia bacterium]|nr:LysM peptidoglycan-binding domain-containing protein [Thermoanaerobaculia bacterium]
MGLFTHHHNDDKEREAVQRHRDAQERLADARRHQQERQHDGMQPQTRTVSSGSMPQQQRATYPEGSWRKEFELYVVKKGDTLFGISKQVYADGNQWHRIQQANPIVLKNPDLIHPGLVLRIPKGEPKPLA